MRRITWLAGLVPLVAAWACSSTGDRPGALGGNPGGDSGTTSSSGGGRDSGTVDAYMCTGGGGDAGCNGLELCGKVVTVVNKTGAAPQAMGGTIYDGTYVLTADLFYPEGSQQVSQALRETLRITGGAAPPDAGSDAPPEAAPDTGSDAGAEVGSEAGADAEVDAEVDAGTEAGSGFITVQEITQEPPASATTFTWDVTFGGVALGWNETCPTASSQSSSFGYTATATTLNLFAYNAGIGTSVTTYTKL